MFRFEDNVSKYLVNESRDFQLLCRIYDILYMGQRADVKTIQDLNSPSKCKTNVLHLLASKVGFFTDKYVDETVLRNITSAFKYVTKYKGTIEAVKEAVIAILKAESTLESPTIIYVPSRGNGIEYRPDGTVVELENTDSTYSDWERSHITIQINARVINTIALEEFLKYVVPFGLTYSIKSTEGSN